MSKTTVNRAEFDTLLTLLHPFAPHITEELWALSGRKTLLAQQPWPTYDEAKTKDATVTIAIQVNGKMRGTIDMPADSNQEDVAAAALAIEKVAAHFNGNPPRKVIYVANKIVNLIV